MFKEENSLKIKRGVLDLLRMEEVTDQYSETCKLEWGKFRMRHVGYKPE